MVRNYNLITIKNIFFFNFPYSTYWFPFQMSMIEKLNSLPIYKRIGELKQGDKYLITHIAKTKTEHGDCIQVILDSKENGFLIKTFLPERYLHCITAEDIQQYKSGKYAKI